MPVNVKLLKKVRKLIAEEPKRLEMATWGFNKSHWKAQGRDLPPCGTVACLAGWTILAATPKTGWRKFFRLDGSISAYFRSQEKTTVPDEAAKLLGISLDNCPFWNSNWGSGEVLAWIDRQIDAASK